MLIAQFVDLLESYNLINAINYMFDKIPISKLKEMRNGESLLVTGHSLSIPQKTLYL